MRLLDWAYLEQRVGLKTSPETALSPALTGALVSLIESIENMRGQVKDIID